MTKNENNTIRREKKLKWNSTLHHTHTYILLKCKVGNYNKQIQRILSFENFHYRYVPNYLEYIYTKKLSVVYMKSNITEHLTFYPDTVLKC